MIRWFLEQLVALINYFLRRVFYVTASAHR